MTIDIVSHRLHNQHLLQADFKTPVEVVDWLGAVQAQDYAGAKWAIGLRTNGLHDADLDQAFADGSILRTHVLRPTWHFLTPTDIRWMLALTAPHIRAQMAYMDRQLELDKATFKKSTTALTKALRGGNQLTRAELGAALEKSGIKTNNLQLGHIMMHAELDALVCSGPRRGKQFTYALMDERVPTAKEWTREDSLAELVTRYFQSHGPATLHDFCVWSGLTLTDARQGMEMVKSQFVSEDIEGKVYWFKDVKPPVQKKSPIAYLLPNYDEYFIGFKDRSAITKFIHEAGIQKEDPALLANVLILNGQVLGGWRRTLKKNQVHVEVTPLMKLEPVQEKAVTQAAERFGAFLNLPVSLIYREYGDEKRTSRSF